MQRLRLQHFRGLRDPLSFKGSFSARSRMRTLASRFVTVWWNNKENTTPFRMLIYVNSLWNTNWLNKTTQYFPYTVCAVGDLFPYGGKETYTSLEHHHRHYFAIQVTSKWCYVRRGIPSLPKSSKQTHSPICDRLWQLPQPLDGRGGHSLQKLLAAGCHHRIQI